MTHGKPEQLLPRFQSVACSERWGALERELKSGGKHPDNCAQLFVEPHGLAERISASAEARLPQVVADEDDRLGARGSVRKKKHSPQRWTQAQCARKIGGHPQRRNFLVPTSLFPDRAGGTERGD